ncbi:DUF5988 family protein [Streptomyces axinellae]|uniref:Nudix hydrolase domain-containing protein n=1 Tax=Streptomyces axinellae TaxID=552788 RepID=A0ABN3QXF6_9ACTN
MTGIHREASEESAVEVQLTGGPVEIPETTRVRQGLINDGIVKIAHRGGYEHFELVTPDTEREGNTPVVFRWTMRTKIAE